MDTQPSIQVAEEIGDLRTYYVHTEFTGCYSIHSTLIQGSRGVALHSIHNIFIQDTVFIQNSRGVALHSIHLTLIQDSRGVALYTT